MKPPFLAVLALLTPVAGAQTIQGERIPHELACAASVRNQAGGPCLQASTTPTLGSLYPLSSRLFVDAASGFVGVGTTNTTARLTISGAEHLNGDLVFKERDDGIVFSSDFSIFPAVPMLTMFGSGTSNPDRMVIGHSATYSEWGLAYEDSIDTFRFQSSSNSPVLRIGLNSRAVQVDGFLGVAASTGLEALSATLASTSSNETVGIRSVNEDPVGFGGIAIEGVHEGAGVGTGVRGESLALFGTGVVGVGNVGVSGDSTSPRSFGLFANGHAGSSGLRTSVQPHATDPAKEIRYVSLEGNEAGTYFRGTTRLARGVAVIDVPEDFRMVTEEAGLTVQVTPLGDVRLWVEERSLERIVVRGHDDVEFDYFVNGVRFGFGDHEPVQANRMFVPRYRAEPFHPELPDAVRERMVENGLLYPDYTPNETTAAQLGWTLTDPPVRSED